MRTIEKMVQNLFDSYAKVYKNTYFWDELATFVDELKAKGFEEKEIRGNKKNGKVNMNFVYSKYDCKYVFILIFTSSEKKVFPLVIDKDVYETKVKGRHISIMQHHHRPLIADEGKIRKLHKFVMDMEDIDTMEIDHITHSSNICVRDLMRVCSRIKNRYNKAVYMTITDENEFTGLFEADTEEDKQYLEELNYKGFYVDYVEKSGLYRITSEEYVSESKLIKDVQKIEKKLMGDYRYDPLLDCTHPISQLLMFKYLFGFISENEFKEGQKYFMQQTKDDFFLEYYDLNK